jgi:hypothetical protein
VKILDMGLARLTDRAAEPGAGSGAGQQVAGTVDYMAPEQALGSASFDHRADIYSLGCTFYFLLAGHAPFPEGTLAQRIVKHQTQQPQNILERRPDAPRDLVRICRKMMAKDPQERYQSAREVAQTLAEWNPTRREIKRAVALDETAASVPGVSDSGVTARLRRPAARGAAARRRTILVLASAAAGLVLLVTAIVLIVVLANRSGTKHKAPGSPPEADATPAARTPAKTEPKPHTFDWGKDLEDHFKTPSVTEPKAGFGRPQVAKTGDKSKTAVAKTGDKSKTAVAKTGDKSKTAVATTGDKSKTAVAKTGESKTVVAKTGDKSKPGTAKKTDGGKTPDTGKTKPAGTEGKTNTTDAKTKPAEVKPKATEVETQAKG